VHWRRADGYVVDTDTSRLDRAGIHMFLVEAYWCFGIPRTVLDRSIDGSICFGVYEPGGAQVGFARVVTDRATFAWIADVFVLPEQRERGLGVWLMECVAAHPDLQGLRRSMLATRDAHGLYRKSGYVTVAERGIADDLMVRPSEAGYGPGAPAAASEATHLPDLDRGQ
jgi:GNAT superfamily N-acetyltransferase